VPIAAAAARRLALRSLGVLVASRLTSALLILAAVSMSAAGCDTVGSLPPADTSAPLRFGIFAADATQPEAVIVTRYQPVRQYFEINLSRPVALTVSPDAGRVLADFEAGRLDAIFNRAFAFPHAQETVGAVPLVTRQEDRHVTTVFLAAATDARRSLQEFRGARLTFSLRLGSSYVMGRHYLDQQQIVPETFFREVHFANVADEAISRVQHGESDLGVANSQALVRMLASGAVQRGELKIIAETPPHVGQLWFVSKNLPQPEMLRIRDAFLALSPARSEHTEVLRVLGASGYVPAIADDYRELAVLMRQMGLLDFDVRQLP
jgi:phosphonate transport system substrate-binding protein